MEGIVAAFRAGDDARIRVLLERLALVGDTETLLWLRCRLNDDLDGSAPATCTRPCPVGSGPRTGDAGAGGMGWLRSGRHGSIDPRPSPGRA
ncbi:hypothetical protein GCM10009731_05340 [Streptomyces globosus]